MGADTRTAGGLTGPALEVVRHPDDRFMDRFIEKNPGYAPLIDSGNPGNWPKSARYAAVATGM